jgi:spectinomycin phosphotransferase
MGHHGVVKTRPADVGDVALVAALSAFGISATALEYQPVGFGSHHWVALDPAGNRHFVTLDDLDTKPWLGRDRHTVFALLRTAYATAIALHEAGLDFVVAPLRASRSGHPIVRLGSRYAVSVSPLLDGQSGRFGAPPDAPYRDRIVELLAAMHLATGAVEDVAPRLAEALPERHALVAGMTAADQPWTGGPYGEPARRWIRSRSGVLQRALDTFGRLGERIRSAGRPVVVTHGEPHAGNVLNVGGRLFLIDWDTVSLAQPERDLSMIGDDAGTFALYEELTGRAVDADALAYFRLAWDLNDAAAFVRGFRLPHADNADSEHAWRSLTGIHFEVHLDQQGESHDRGLRRSGQVDDGSAAGTPVVPGS